MLMSSIGWISLGLVPVRPPSCFLPMQSPDIAQCSTTMVLSMPALPLVTVITTRRL